METETRQCQMCKKDFSIESEDFMFYDKIKVPPPTFCPTCRAQRRMSFLNERILYKRKCDLTGESIISLFPEDAVVPVYSPQAWWSDKWDATEYGQDYDFSRPFFEQFGELLRRVPQFSLQNQYSTLIRTKYVNMGTYDKDCYMVFNTAHSEECLHTSFTLKGKKCIDIYRCEKCELCYDSVNIYKCFKVYFSENIQESSDIWFSKNLRGCMNCLGCSNLVNKKYCIWNKQYSKEDYFEEIKKFNLGSSSQVEELRSKADIFHKTQPKKFMEGVKGVDVSGNEIYNSKNVHDSYYIVGVKDSKYCQFLFYGNANDCYDMTMWGGGAELIYECMGAGDNESNVKFSFDCWAPGFNIEYSYHIVSPNKNIFGCIGLKNKEYCILNKQYTKEEYEELIPKIKQHMSDMPYVDKKGRVYKYGEFFPTEISLFDYNETLAQSYFPLSRDEAVEKGYSWKERIENEYQITIKAADLKDDIKDIDESILNEVIECEVSKRAFKITLAEFQFYKMNNIPIPRLHPDERHKRRLEKKNPFQLWHRRCMCEKTDHDHEGLCPNEFETSYPPVRSGSPVGLTPREIVYCETCYQKEIY